MNNNKYTNIKKPLAVVRVAVVVLVAEYVDVVWDVLIDAVVVLVGIVVEFEGSSFAVKI